MEQNGGEQINSQVGVQTPINTPQVPTAPLPPTQPVPPNESPTTEPGTEQNALLQWNASEFIDHHKNLGWFIPLFFGVLVLAAGVFFVTRDILSTVVIVLAGIAFGAFARQKPRTLTYTLLPTSLKIGSKTYSYDDFKTFSIIQDGALFSVLLEPIKRFMPPLSIYFAPEDGERIFDTLAGHLPHQERQPDPVDRLMRKIRF